MYKTFSFRFRDRHPDGVKKTVISVVKNAFAFLFLFLFPPMRARFVSLRHHAHWLGVHDKVRN